MGILHVVLSLTNGGIQDIGYLYIHEDKVSEANVSANRHYHWRFIRQKLRSLQAGQNPPSSQETSED